MKKRPGGDADLDLPADLLVGFFKRGTRGKYHRAYTAGRDTVCMVALAPDVAEEFATADEVNTALRLVKHIRDGGKPARRKRPA